MSDKINSQLESMPWSYQLDPNKFDKENKEYIAAKKKEAEKCWIGVSYKIPAPKEPNPVTKFWKNTFIS